MANNPKITSWRSLWDNLKWGPRGALIAFVAASLYRFVPSIPRVIISLIFIAIVTILGALAGSLFGWFLEQAKKKK